MVTICITHKQNTVTLTKNMTHCWHLCRFLGNNKISCVEGLMSVNKLQELYVENQQLPVGDHIEFEPESLNAIAVSWRWSRFCILTGCMPNVSNVNENFEVLCIFIQWWKPEFKITLGEIKFCWRKGKTEHFSSFDLVWDYWLRIWT